MKKLAVALSLLVSFVAVANSNFPTNAQAGQCFKEIVSPAKYKTIDKKVLVKEESKSIKIIPAQYTTVQEQVLVKEASEKLTKIPASYKWVSESVINKPAYSKWVRDPKTGILCKKEVEASYKTIKRKVVDQPATTTKQVIPAEYKTVTVTKLVKGPQEVVEVIPAEYNTITETQLVSDASTSWNQVICRTNGTSVQVRKLQEALQAKGYYKGPIDSILGPQTFNASRRFAADNALPSGYDFVTISTYNAAVGNNA